MENSNSNLGLNLPVNPPVSPNGTQFNQYSPYLPPPKPTQVAEATPWEQFLEVINSKKLTEIAIWLVLLVLFVPSGMAVASWNAVPGDYTYSWKISLEKGLLLVLKPSKTLQTSTQVVLTQRRFSEASKMLSGDKADVGLKNLTEQVHTTSQSIQSLSAGSSKTEFKQQYIAALTELNQKLEQEKKFHQGATSGTTRTNTGSVANLPRQNTTTQVTGGTTIVQNTYVQNVIVQNVTATPAPGTTIVTPPATENTVANEITNTQEEIQQTIEELQAEVPVEEIIVPTSEPPTPVPVEPTTPPAPPQESNQGPSIQNNGNNNNNGQPFQGNDNSDSNEPSNHGGNSNNSDSNLTGN